jgi:rRNA processing protein Gar1
LKRLGTVVHVAPGNKLIVQSDTKPKNLKLNAIALTEQMRKIGRIVDIFGPVSKPYFSIKLFSDSDSKTQKLRDKKIYTK